MKKHLGMFILAVALIAVLLISTLAYTVDEQQDICVIQTFGKITAVKEGKADAGLNFKWPWPVQRLIRYDRRTRMFEDTTTQTSTKEKDNILVTLYCAWRIEDPAKFQRNVENADSAVKLLRDLLQDAKGTVVGRHYMSEFVNTDPSQMRIPEIEKEILQALRDALCRGDKTDEKTGKNRFGIEVVRVGLKTLALPNTVTVAVIDSMKEERQRMISQLKSEGEAEAKAIIEQARTARSKILKFAERRAEEIRTEGYLAAARYYKEYGKDYKLAMFLRALDSLRSGLKERSVILLDGSELPAIKWLRQKIDLSDLPGEDSPPPAAAPTGKTPPAKPARPAPAKPGT